MGRAAAAPNLRTDEADLPDARSAGVWAHIKAAFEYNDDLWQRSAWCVGVDWRRALDNLWVSGRLDRFYHIALCWEWWAVAQYRFAYWALHRKIPHLGRWRFLQRVLFLQQAILLRFCYLLSKIV